MLSKYYRIFISAVVICFLSCNSSTELDNTKIISSRSGDTLKISMGAYYLLDDKYAESSDTLIINKWFESKLNYIENFGIRDNLFEKKGGGPYGAEWNPSTDIYIIITINKDIDSNSFPVVKLNGKDQDSIKVMGKLTKQRIGTILYFKLSWQQWHSNLKKIYPNMIHEILQAVDNSSPTESLTVAKNLINKASSYSKEDSAKIAGISRLNISIEFKCNSKTKEINLEDNLLVAFGE